jgi:hypothetical protein
LNVFYGIDWAEQHHDVALVDIAGQLVIKRRISDNVDGFIELLDILAGTGDSPDDPIPVAIETSRGLLVAALRATGREVYAINPMAMARYRERHSMTRKKSDHLDAMTLANILRTDADAHRPLPADTELAQAVTVLARAAQDAIWRRTKATQELRALLREYYPTFLDAFTGGVHTNLAKPDARAVLALAPTPEQGATLTKASIIAALRRAGRQRRLDQTADRIHQALRRPQLRQPPWWKVRWAAKHGHCLPRSTSNAPTPTSSTRPRSKLSKNIPTTTSSPAFPASARPPERACWPKSAMTAAALPTPEG